ncbi:MAG: hypothetical protein J6X33_01685, partial [Clostridiales bacterium]|nr:hypothetical protein [Clostridiales bacterium]
METRSLSRLAKLGSALLITAISASFISFWPGNTSRAVEKGFKKTKENTRLDSSEISAHQTVYFGRYNEKPIDFNIYKVSTTEFGGTSMFLRSKNILFKRAFDANHNIWKDSSRYIYSDLYIYLNYYFIYDAFTPSEQDAII